MNVEELMIKNVYTVHPDTPVEEAVKTMNTYEIGCLVVVESERPVGIITERDLLKRVLEQGKPPKTVKVDEIMSKPVIYGNPQMELEDAARLMFRKKVKKLPIMQDGELVGLITLTDLAKTAHIDQKMMHMITELKESGWLPPKRMEKIINVYVT
ncbi:MAG TPA: CBS domain-containing protein [Candidatus Krumholzibacteriaceae bacterium]|jgi:CBS domain-containing protein|nr:CBS domain-containing protein [Candidatus Krumholzibacteriaceae bacterium]